MGSHPTLLLTGATGLVGAPLYRAALAGWRVVVVTHDRSAPGPLRRGDRAVECDLLAPGAIEALIHAIAPQAIVHLAALASLTECEAAPARAQLLNVDATARLAQAAAREGAFFVHLSTDQLFAGDRSWPEGVAKGYREGDPVSPLHHYGRTKMLAESAVAASGAEALVLRSALVLAPSADGRHGALDHVRGAPAGATVRLYSDEWRTPISVLDLARLLDVALARRLTGVLHAAGAERVDRFALGRAIDAAFPVEGGGAPRTLVAATQADAGSVRPRDVSLTSVRVEVEELPAAKPLVAALAELREWPAR